MVTVNRILCPTDFSDISSKAEAYATALARHYAAGLVLLHVDPPMPLMAPYGEMPVDVRMFEDQRQQALVDLAAATTRCRAVGVAATTELRGGYPAREILTVAKEQAVDLVVLGTHGSGGVEHLLLGSVAEKVLRKARCAVMVVPPGAVGPVDGVFSHVLCPVDGSAASAEAVAFALSLARETDGVLTLLQVVEPIPTSGDFAAIDVVEYRRAAEVEAAAALQTAVPAAVREWCEVADVVAFGKPSTCIVETAAASQADVIVMGVRGRGAIDVLAFGSTANDVVRRARCPVVAVHPRGADDRQATAAPAVIAV